MSAVAVLHIENVYVASSPVPNDEKSGLDLLKERAGEEHVNNESGTAKKSEKGNVAFLAKIFSFSS